MIIFKQVHVHLVTTHSPALIQHHRFRGCKMISKDALNTYKYSSWLCMSNVFHVQCKKASKALTFRFKNY